MSTTISEFIPAQLDNGSAALPLRATHSKHGNAYWAIQGKKADGSRYVSGYGVNVSKALVGDKLPSSITVLGETFTFVQDKTEKEQLRLRASGKVVVPGHGKKVFSFRITVTDPEQGLFNISGSVHGESTGGRGHILDEL